MPPRKALIQFSIAEVITVLTVLCLLAGMIWSDWWMLEHLFFVVVMAALLMTAIACTAMGETRRFAAGFSVLMIGYLLLSVAIQAGTFKVFSVYVNELPTTMLWENGHDLVKRKVYKYQDTKEIISRSLGPYKDEQGQVRDHQGNVLGIHGTGTSSMRGILIYTYPTDDAYDVVGELFWALLLGYLGGKFVVGFHRYQENARPA